LPCENAAKLGNVLTSLQGLLRLATLRWLGVFICALAVLLATANTASALAPAQTKTCVWGLDFAEHNPAGLFRAATSGKHQANRLARAEEASGSLLAAGAGATLAVLGRAAARGAGAVEGQLPKYLYHYTSTETAALIESSALGQAGRTLYLTPSGGLSPIQAGIELALPQANTAGALFRVPTSALEAGQILRVGPVTGNVLGRGGGGIEILYNGEIPLNFVTRVR
jgi:hypothetical protein